MRITLNVNELLECAERGHTRHQQKNECRDCGYPLPEQDSYEEKLRGEIRELKSKLDLALRKRGAR